MLFRETHYVRRGNNPVPPDSGVPKSVSGNDVEGQTGRDGAVAFYSSWSQYKLSRPAGDVTGLSGILVLICNGSGSICSVKVL